MNKVDNSIVGLVPDKFKKGMKKVPSGEKPTTQILEYSNKSLVKKIRLMINKKYPRVERDLMKNERTHYQDVSNLF